MTVQALTGEVNITEHLFSVSANLTVAVALSCAVGIVQPFQNGVFAKQLLDFQNCFLSSAFCFSGLHLAFVLSLDFIIVRKKVKLHRSGTFMAILFSHHPVNCERETSHKKVPVDNPVV